MREIVVPALTSLTAQSPGLTPFRSPSGPMHRVAATGLPEAFKTWTAHSASSTCSKYCKEAQNVKTAELLKQFKAAVGALWYPSALQRPAAFLGQSFWFSGQANKKKKFKKRKKGKGGAKQSTTGQQQLNISLLLSTAQVQKMLHYSKASLKCQNEIVVHLNSTYRSIKAYSHEYSTES